MTATEVRPAGSAGIWTTFRDAPRAVKTILTGVFINRLGGLLNIFLVLFMTSKGYSAEQASLALGVYGGGAVVGVHSRAGSAPATPPWSAWPAPGRCLPPCCTCRAIR